MIVQIKPFFHWAIIHQEEFYWITGESAFESAYLQKCMESKKNILHLMKGDEISEKKIFQI